MVERGYCIYSISLNILTYFLPLNNYLVTLFHNTICRAQLFCRFLLSASEYLSNMLFSYHLLYFCTALSLIIMLSSHYHHHKSKTFSQLTQCPFTGTLLLLRYSKNVFKEIRMAFIVVCHIVIIISHSYSFANSSSFETAYYN